MAKPSCLCRRKDCPGQTLRVLCPWYIRDVATAEAHVEWPPEQRPRWNVVLAKRFLDAVSSYRNQRRPAAQPPPLRLRTTWEGDEGRWLNPPPRKP